MVFKVGIYGTTHTKSQNELFFGSEQQAPLLAAAADAPLPDSIAQDVSQQPVRSDGAEPIAILESRASNLATGQSPGADCSQQAKSVDSPPQRSSWFSSLSRARVRSPIASPAPSGSHTTTPTSAELPKVHPQSLPQSIPVTPKSDAALGFAVPSSSQTQSLPNTQPSSPNIYSAPQSVVPSLDDEVPALKLSKDVECAPPSSDDSAKVVTRRASVSGLNPSSSRFMLRIPLLGRPKTPLEEVIAHVGEDSSESSPDNSTTFPISYQAY